PVALHVGRDDRRPLLCLLRDERGRPDRTACADEEYEQLSHRYLPGGRLRRLEEHSIGCYPTSAMVSPDTRSNAVDTRRNASTTSGSKCVPRPLMMSFTVSSCGRHGRESDRARTASWTSTSRMTRAVGGISGPRRPCGYPVPSQRS